MATSKLEKVKGELECPMCLEVFQEPVTLNCGHSFCTKCLDKYVSTHGTAEKDKVLPCSVCRHETKVPDPEQPMAEWGKQLMPSFTIKKLIEQVNEPAETSSYEENCFVCNSLGETTVASLWCPECEMSFCQRCSQQHAVLPSSKDHELDKMNTESKRRKSLKIKCPQHKKGIKFHCKACNKSICSTCCILSHKRCDDIVLLDSMMDEMKSSISQSHLRVAVTLDGKKETLVKLKSMLESVDTRHSATVSKIRDLETRTMDIMKEKFQEDVDEVNRLAEEEKIRLRSEIKKVEIDVQVFEQHSSVLKEVLGSENNNEIYRTHEFCQSGSLFPHTDLVGRLEKHVVDLDYDLNLDRIRQMLTEMGRICVFLEGDSREKCSAESSVPLSKAILTSQMPTETRKDRNIPRLEDITVVALRDAEAIVVTDADNDNVKCFYTSPNSTLPSTLPKTSHNTPHSVCVMGDTPRGITKLTDYRVMVSFPDAYKLVIFRVTPHLARERSITTQEEYRSLQMLDNGQLVASTSDPGRVDLLDVTWQTAVVIKTISVLDRQFASPWCMSVNRQDGNNVLLSVDGDTFVCVTMDGDVTWTYSSATGRHFQPYSATATQRGDVICLDKAANAVFLLSRTGEHKADILTNANRQFIAPKDIYYHECGYLYVVDQDRVLVYKLIDM